MVGDNMKKRKRKINKKRILILILFLLIILSIGIYLIVPKRYGYQKDVINVFKEDNYYEKIKETKKYSKTLETAVIENNYKKEYFDEYLDINYVEEERYLLMIYDLRSAIAHGNFEQIDTIAKKMDKWLLNNSIDYKKYYEGFDTDIVFEYIEESLEKYVRTSIKMLLEDQNLIELLKK